MGIPLISGWESMVSPNKVCKKGPKERRIIDECFDKLHELGRMSWAKGHTPDSYPAFVVYRSVRNPDGTTTTKERVVIELRGVNKISKPDIYPLPTQDEVLQLLRDKFFISVVDARKIFHQWRIKKQHGKRMAVLAHRGARSLQCHAYGVHYLSSMCAASDGAAAQRLGSFLQGLYR